MNTNNEERVNVGVTIPKSELEEMKRVTRVDLNGTTVLALARKGLDLEKKHTEEFSQK